MQRFALAAATFALAALPAAAASTVQPPQPSAFDPVNLRMTVDSCTFVPASVQVTSAGDNTLRVTQQPNMCLVPGTPQLVDVRLGTLAPGDYRVEVYAASRADAQPVERLQFTVAPRAEIAVYPPPNRPLADHSGVWHNPDRSGWGLTLNQSPNHSIFGALFVYDTDNRPLWFTLQGGQWTSATTWKGTLYRTTGPSFSDPGFDPKLVLIRADGDATIDFAAVPATGRATLTYTVNGVAVSAPIARMIF